MHAGGFLSGRQPERDCRGSFHSNLQGNVGEGKDVV